MRFTIAIGEMRDGSSGIATILMGPFPGGYYVLNFSYANASSIRLTRKRKNSVYVHA